MAGLCNVCTEHGAENFNTLDALLTTLEENWHKDSATECPIPDLLLHAKMYKGYLLSDFIYHLENHSECATHCMCWYLSVTDRTREAQLAKTWEGISNYFSFVYHYNANLECCEIMAQEQTGLVPSATLKKGQMDNLWLNCSVDTGAQPHFKLEKGNQKPPLIEKKKVTALVVGREHQQQQNVQIEKVSSNCLTKCPECGMCFLRKGNLNTHRESKGCLKRKKS